MRKWLLLVVVLLAVALLVGCKSGTGTAGLGEGRGAITPDDFSPFGQGRAPVDLVPFTAQRDGRYRVTLASGSGRDALRNPQIWIMRGRVPEDREGFLRAFDRGRGVAFQGDGQNIADVSFGATGGDMFTIVFSSKSNDIGTYNFEISGGGGGGRDGGGRPPHH